MVGGGLYGEEKVGFYKIVGKWSNDLAPDSLIVKEDKLKKNCLSRWFCYSL